MNNACDDALKALRELLHNDPETQASLFKQDSAAFIAEILKIAQSHHLTLDENTLLQAMQTGRLAWRQRSQR